MSVQTTYSNFPAVAFAGQLATMEDTDIITGFNEDTSDMPFGIAVSYKASPTYNTDMTLPVTSGGAKVAGILIHSHAHERQYSLPDGTLAGDLAAGGLVPGAKLDILRRGRVWVITQQAVAVGDRLFVCFSAGTVYTAAGQLGNADESSNTLDCTRLGQWVTAQTTPGGLALLDVNFVARNS
jgi:hypothetical protein